MRGRITCGLLLLVATAGCNAILDNKLYDLADGGQHSTIGEDATTDGTPPASDGAPADRGIRDATSEDATVDHTDGGDGAIVDAGQASEAGEAGDGGCASLTDIRSCGSCSNDCTQLLNVNPTGIACTGGRCTYTCAPNTADCADAGIGCGTALTSTSNCGACGAGCSSAMPVCAQSDGGAYACATGCAARETNCSGTCARLESDTSHCGSCGHACTGDQTCQAGVCACPAGTTLCAGTCVNVLGSDVANCGACGTSCAQLPHVLTTTGLACSAGMCSYQCASGYADCTNTGAGCTTNLSSTSSCGACTVTCSGGTPACQLGGGGVYGCATGCMPGQANCSGTCTTVATDSSNCGMCGKACVTGQSCQGGTCSCPTASPDVCGNACTSLQSDNANCGSCTHTCPSAQSCQGGVCACPTVANPDLCGTACVNKQTDGANCGTCGHACPTVQTCQAGVCQCPTSGKPTLCGGACVNLQNSGGNCGRCGHSCQGGSCSSGVCQPLPIAPLGSSNFVAALAVDSSFVYWVEQQDVSQGFGAGSVKKAPISGTQAVTTLAGNQDTPSGIGVNATGVFWINEGFSTSQNGGLVYLPAGAINAVRLATSFFVPSAMALTAGNVYWIDDTMGGSGRGESLLALPMSNLSGAAAPANLQSVATCGAAMALGTANIYWLQTGCFGNSGTIQSATISPFANGVDLLASGVFLNGPYNSQPALQTSFPARIAIDSQRIYFASTGASAEMLEFIPIGGGGPTILSSTASPNGVAVDASNVYWTDKTTVMSIPIGGGAPTTLASSQTAPWDIVVDATSVYWTNNANNTASLTASGVMKVAKP